jgi:hypothetical protein
MSARALTDFSAQISRKISQSSSRHIRVGLTLAKAEALRINSVYLRRPSVRSVLRESVWCSASSKAVLVK